MIMYSQLQNQVVSLPEDLFFALFQTMQIKAKYMEQSHMLRSKEEAIVDAEIPQQVIRFAEKDPNSKPKKIRVRDPKTMSACLQDFLDLPKKEAIAQGMKIWEDRNSGKEGNPVKFNNLFYALKYNKRKAVEKGKLPEQNNIVSYNKPDQYSMTQCLKLVLPKYPPANVRFKNKETIARRASIIADALKVWIENHPGKTPSFNMGSLYEQANAKFSKALKIIHRSGNSSNH